MGKSKASKREREQSVRTDRTSRTASEERVEESKRQNLKNKMGGEIERERDEWLRDDFMKQIFRLHMSCLRLVSLCPTNGWQLHVHMMRFIFCQSSFTYTLLHLRQPECDAQSNPTSPTTAPEGTSAVCNPPPVTQPQTETWLVLWKRASIRLYI